MGQQRLGPAACTGVARVPRLLAHCGKVDAAAAGKGIHGENGQRRTLWHSHMQQRMPASMTAGWVGTPRHSRTGSVQASRQQHGCQAHRQAHECTGCTALHEAACNHGDVSPTTPLALACSSQTSYLGALHSPSAPTNPAIALPCHPLRLAPRLLPPPLRCCRLQVCCRRRRCPLAAAAAAAAGRAASVRAPLQTRAAGIRAPGRKTAASRRVK